MNGSKQTTPEFGTQEQVKYFVIETLILSL
jgi:hypothetical protein